MSPSYFTVPELVHSNIAARRGIDNTPSPKIESNLNNLIQLVLNPLREEVGKPIIVTSGYRCPALNQAVGGSEKSQHMSGLAADIVCHRISVDELFRIACEMSDDDEIWADQIINEYGRWVHISTKKTNRRKQYFRIG